MIRQLVLLAMTYVSVTSALPPCVCTRELKPVCGTDGETYSNMCRLRCEQGSNPGLQLGSQGACPGDEAYQLRPCICNLIEDPVCASDGRTYPNKCVMDCDGKGNLQVVHNGLCENDKAAERVCICPYDYTPVCGTDGQTYGNECSLKCEDGVEVAYPGECRNKRDAGECLFCPANYAPVCGTDGKTYANGCDLNCNGAGAEVAYDGECRAKRQTHKPCPLLLAPVCGTDGKTYPNECVLENSDDGTSLAHHGSCRNKRQAESGCFCTYENDPVCGTNGRTYSNPCSLECEGDVQVAYRGECRDKRETVKIASLPRCLCSREARPVCGTDGRTYSNPCMLDCARERNEDLQIDYNGSCKDDIIVREVIPDRYPSCTCPRIMQPVCASNGRSYNSECEMLCDGEELTVEKYGRCEN